MIDHVSPAPSLGNSDEDVVAALTKMLPDLDPDREHALRHEQFVAEFPQTGERVRGRDGMRRLQRAFPSGQQPTFTVIDITGHGDDWTVQARGDYGGETSWVIVVLRLDQGRILRETRYYAGALPAPPWRAHLVEMVDAEHARDLEPEPAAAR